MSKIRNYEIMCVSSRVWHAALNTVSLICKIKSGSAGLTLVGHFLVSQRKEIVEMKKKDRRKRNRSDSEETEEIKHSPPYPYLLQG